MFPHHKERNLSTQTQSPPRFLRLPREAYQLAERHGLGVPQRIHTRLFDRVVEAGCGGFLLFIGLGNLIILTFGLYSPFDAQQYRSAGFWVGVILALLGAVPFLINVISEKNVAYECSLGFLVVRERSRQIVLALRWDEIDRAWQSHSHKSRTYFITYRKGNNDPEDYELSSGQLWKRCDFEVRHRLRRRARHQRENCS